MNLKFLATACLAFIVAAAIPISHAQSATAARCNVSVGTVWASGPTPKLRIEAFSDGPSCAKAVIVYVVRTSSGRVLHSASYTSEFVSTTGDARTPSQMRTALSYWIGVRGNRFDNASLPNWLPNAEEPEAREFGFFPDESISRADYLAVRASRTPLLCYAQGIESMKCLIWRNNSLEPFGVQAFPG
jgi:hypothetical protein